ncbi:prolyl oligopeptidase family serine peptidase [Shivajiella indica]|uniref:Prolyl oligopeptidase family serine peptidase n=1 Tax=Shivajiella indica TaxID=872115 RepID=A0ABW5BE61_9BACT
MEQTKFLKYLALPVLILLLFVQSCQPDKEPIEDENVAMELFDVSYGDHPRHKMDIFLPANRTRENTRLLIWIHGGAWVDGDKGEFVDFKPWFEEVQDDYAYISLNYRLFDVASGANKFPSQEEDIKMALDYIKQKLPEWKVSDQVILSGGSAGGHLALLHSYKNNSDGLVKVVAAVFPPTELFTLGNGNPLITFLLQTLVGNPETNSDMYINSSPINFIDSQSVPTTFYHGDADEVVPIDQSYLLEEKLRENNVPLYFEYYPGQGHGFTDQTYQNMIRKIEEFINLHL